MDFGNHVRKNVGNHGCQNWAWVFHTLWMFTFGRLGSLAPAPASLSYCLFLFPGMGHLKVNATWPLMKFFSVLGTMQRGGPWALKSGFISRLAISELRDRLLQGLNFFICKIGILVKLTWKWPSEVMYGKLFIAGCYHVFSKWLVELP